MYFIIGKSGNNSYKIQVFNGIIFNIFSNQITERRIIEKHLEKTIQYIQMSYTEEIIKIDLIMCFQQQNSVRIVPHN